MRQLVLAPGDQSLPSSCKTSAYFKCIEAAATEAEKCEIKARSSYLAKTQKIFIQPRSGIWCCELGLWNTTILSHLISLLVLPCHTQLVSPSFLGSPPHLLLLICKCEMERVRSSNNLVGNLVGNFSGEFSGETVILKLFTENFHCLHEH